MDREQLEYLLVKNSLYCGHFLVAWAMLLNLLHLAFFHDTASMFGIVVGGVALFAAWLLPSFVDRRIPAAATFVSWLVAIVVIYK